MNKYRIIEKGLIIFFIFQVFFITFRLILVGSGTSENAFEAIVALLPEVFMLLFVITILYSFSLDQSYKDFILYDYIIIGYIVSNVVLGVFLSGDLKISFYGIRLTYLPMLFYFIGRFCLHRNDLKSEKLIEKILRWYILVAVIGLVIYFLFPEVDIYFTDLAGGVQNYYYIKRMGSIFWTPVVWGTFMSVATLFYYFKIAKEFKWINFFIFCLFWLCLFLSVSRGALITFFFGMIVITISFQMWKRFLLSIGSFVLLVSLLSVYNPVTLYLVGFISDSSIETFENITSKKTNAYILRDSIGQKPSNSRAKLWAESIKDFIEKPQGYGLGKAGHIASRFFEPGTKDAAVYSTDGWYLKLANETGIWGLVSYFILGVVHLLLSFKYWKYNKQSFFGFYFVFFLVIGIQNIVSNVLDFYSFSCFYWLIIGLTHNSLNKHNESGN